MTQFWCCGLQALCGAGKSRRIWILWLLDSSAFRTADNIFIIHVHTTQHMYKTSIGIYMLVALSNYFHCVSGLFMVYPPNYLVYMYKLMQTGKLPPWQSVHGLSNPCKIPL